jgi:hypothetical protein
MKKPSIFTIGHSTRSIDEFVGGLTPMRRLIADVNNVHGQYS